MNRSKVLCFKGYQLVVSEPIIIQTIYQEGKSYFFAADETVKGKAVKQTHGLGRFYSGMPNRQWQNKLYVLLAF